MTPSTKDDTQTTSDIRKGTAESLRFLEDDSIDLVICSPPYWQARQYDKFDGKTLSYKQRDYDKAGSTYSEYLSFMTRCIAEMFRVLKPGRVCAINVGAIRHEGAMMTIPADLWQCIKQVGFLSGEEIVWAKASSSSDRFGTYIKAGGKPHYYYPNDSTERILIARKPGPKAYKSIPVDRLEKSRRPISELAKSDFSSDVWSIAALRRGSVNHPAGYPQDLVARLLLAYSAIGDTVLDPFVGSGQTGIVASAFGRKFVGVDRDERFVEYARSRQDEPLSIRCRQLRVRYEHIEDDPFLDPAVSGSGAPTTGSVDPGSARRNQS